jgi:hypothetical protein
MIISERRFKDWGKEEWKKFSDKIPFLISIEDDKIIKVCFCLTVFKNWIVEELW